MSLPLFIDHCVPSAFTRAMTAAGHGATRLAERLPVESPDPTVLRQSQELDAILVSINGDFADIVTYPPAQYGGIIALQLHNQPSTLGAIVSRLLQLLLTTPYARSLPRQALHR